MLCSANKDDIPSCIVLFLTKHGGGGAEGKNEGIKKRREGNHEPAREKKAYFFL